MSDMIRQIANIITDDPDIYLEDTMGGMSAGSMSGTPSSMSSSSQSNTSDQALNKMLKDQENARKKAELDRQRKLKPEFDRMNKSLTDMNKDNMTNQRNTNTAHKDMQDNINNIQNMMGHLEKEI